MFENSLVFFFSFRFVSLLSSHLNRQDEQNDDFFQFKKRENFLTLENFLIYTHMN